jgi:hypothetical protein
MCDVDGDKAQAAITNNVSHTQECMGGVAQQAVCCVQCPSALQGDNDPVDVVEIGGRPMPSGAVFHVKFLGAFAMIDGKELDWKIICINRDSPLAAKLDTITDVER